MNTDQHRDGLDRINRAISAAIPKKAASISFSSLRPPAVMPSAMFEVTVAGNSVQKLFSYEEIADSHEQLTVEARMKVRQLAAEIALLPITSDALPGYPTQRDRR